MAYESLIVHAIQCTEPEAELVESEMRARTYNGCLDHLRPEPFRLLARACYRDLYEGVGCTSPASIGTPSPPAH